MLTLEIVGSQPKGMYQITAAEKVLQFHAAYIYMPGCIDSDYTPHIVVIDGSYAAYALMAVGKSRFVSW